jgi:hypothetical protein
VLIRALFVAVLAVTWPATGFFDAFRLKPGSHNVRGSLPAGARSAEAGGFRLQAEERAWTPRIEPVTTPAGPNSLAPQLIVSMKGPLLSWIERTGESATLKFSEWTSSSWSGPQTAASGTNWFVNWADVPSVMRLSDGTLAAHWLQKSGTGSYAYDLRLAYSSDSGRTWSRSFTPHVDGTLTEHGFASLFEMPEGGLGVVWLDGRAMKNHGNGGHGGPGGGAMSLRFARYDRAWKRILDEPLDLRVCDCCPTSAAVTADGPIAAFRDHSDREVRDIHVARRIGGRWAPSRAVHADGWTINACPVNGPMLSAKGQNVAVAWFTVQKDLGHAFVAFSPDGGKAFGTPIRLDDDAAMGRVDVDLMDDQSAVASWIETAGQQAQFKVRRVWPDGSRSPSVSVSGLAAGRASGYPRLAAHDGELIFAWTDARDGATQVRTAIARQNRSRPPN